MYKYLYQNILTYMYSKNPLGIPNQSINLNYNNTTYICWSTLVLSPMVLSLFFYRVYVTRCHRVPIDRSS